MIWIVWTVIYMEQNTILPPKHRRIKIHSIFFIFNIFIYYFVYSYEKENIKRKLKWGFLVLFFLFLNFNVYQNENAKVFILHYSLLLILFKSFHFLFLTFPVLFFSYYNKSCFLSCTAGSVWKEKLILLYLLWHLLSL